MKQVQVIICIISMFLFLTGTFSIANASGGYTKTIHIGGSNEVEYTYTKDEEPAVSNTVPSQNTNNTILIQNPYAYPYYNPYGYTQNYGYGYSGSHVYVGYPRTYIFPGFKPNPPMHKPNSGTNIKPPHNKKQPMHHNSEKPTNKPK